MLVQGDDLSLCLYIPKCTTNKTRPISARKRFMLTEIIEKPVLREDTLTLTKTEDTGKKPTKAKAEEAEAEVATEEKA